MNRKPDIFDRLMQTPLLRPLQPFYAKYKAVLLYVFFGGLTTLVSIGSFALLDTVLSLHELVANVIAWIAAVLFAYVTNRRWVFGSTVRGTAIWRELLSFAGGRLLTLGAEEGVLLLFVTCLQYPAVPIKILAQVMVLVGNYILSKWFVFKKK